MNAQEQQFHASVMEYYQQYGRHSLPWRVARGTDSIDPYCVVVSEYMLQQTQVVRVLTKYPLFLSRFPTVDALAAAPQSAVVRVWQGLGYNRRAIALYRSALRIVQEYGGRIPCAYEDLISLPGIGPATAGAIQAFAFNKPVVFIETNIRRAFIDFFFTSSENVADKDIVPLVEKTQGNVSPREWYYALMDYGAFLSKQKNNPNRKSAHYSLQSPFEGSNRQLRAATIRMLLDRPRSRDDIVKTLSVAEDRMETILFSLQKDGFIRQDATMIFLV